MDVGSLVTRLMMDANQFDSTINKSQKEIAAFKSKAENVGRGVNSVFNGMAGTALKLVPAIAAGTTALGAFNKILKSSGSLADSFDKISLQIGSAIDYMADRAAELNFDNAINGLKESLKIAGQLAETLDAIGTLNSFKNIDVATLRRLEAEQKRAKVNYELNPNKETKAALDASTAALKRQQAKVSDTYDSIIKEEKNKTEELKAGVANSAGFKNDPLANWVVENLARNKQNLARSQERYKAFSDRDISYFNNGKIIDDRRFKANTGKNKNPGNANTTAVSGLDILRRYDWNRIAKSALRPEFEKFFEKTTGYRFTKENYEKQRRYILISNKEGLGEGKTDITAVQNQIANVEDLEADKISSEAQTLLEEKKAKDKIDKNNNKVNTKLTNTNESLEEINKKFSDAKALLSLQKNEGYLDNESYLKELLKTTDNYIAKLYDPIYANAEGIKDLRSAAISAKEGIIKQLKDLNKEKDQIKFGNTDFNLISSDIYKQVERVITSQLGSYYNGRELEGFFSDWNRFTNGWNIFKAKPGDDVSKYIYDTISINRSEDLNYGKIYTTILENEKDINKILNEKVSDIFNDAFKQQGDYVTASQVYDFLNAVRIMSALPEEMARKFKEVWIHLINNPDDAVAVRASKIEYGDAIQKNTTSSIAASLIPNINKYVDPDYRPISSIQDARVKAARMRGLNIYQEDLDDFYKQNAPVQTKSDLIDRLRAYKDFNRLNPLQYFNSLDSQLTTIDNSVQKRIKILKNYYLGLLNSKYNFEEQIRTGKYSFKDENGKTVEKELTEDQKTYAINQLKPVELEINRLNEYIKQLEETQEATQKLVQISQVFNIKQKEIKEKFDDWRTFYGSLSNVASAFSEMDNKVGEFAKSLEVLSNSAVIIVDLIEQLNSLNEAKKASAIADEVLAGSTAASTAAILTNTAASNANAASNTAASVALTETATSAATAAGGLFAAAAAAAANTAANVAEAGSEGTKQASKLPFPANIAAIAAVLAAVGGAAATISSLSRKKYATGGIVTGPGSSFSDSIPISVSNGEMILNKSQQRNLFDLLNYGGGSSRGGGTSEVNFKILGENLVGSINNRNKGRNKIL